MKANVPVAVITGGSEGIGFACASFFARKGYKTCLVARNAEKLECARSRISSSCSVEVMIIPTDVGDEKSVNQAVSSIIDEYGRIDILINAAGSSMHSPKLFEAIPSGEYHRIMSANIDGVFFMTRAVLPHMIGDGQECHIINILSTAAHSIGDRNSVYSASKSAAMAFTKALDKQLYGSNVKISSISPGPVNTTIWSHKDTPPSEARKALMLQPEDIVRIVDMIVSSPFYVSYGDIVVRPWRSEFA